MKIFLSRSCLVVLLGIVLLLCILIVPVAADTMTTEPGTNRDGGDYTHLDPGIAYLSDSGSFMFYDGSASACSNFCLGQAQCQAATYVAADQTCWLKSSVPAATSNSGMTSFTKGPSGGGCYGITPLADFSAVPRAGPVSLDVQFTDQSTGASSWSWNFGDTGTSTQQHPLHKYTQPGTYPVTLTIAGVCPGQSDTETKAGYITVSGNIVAIMGSLDVSSIPSGARVRVDGDDKGTTPVKVSLPSGHITVLLTLSGYKDYTTPEQIFAGQTTHIHQSLTKSSVDPSTTGSLQITTVPDGAAVSVDGESQGTTPVTVTGLAAGSHTVKLSKAGYTDYTPTLTITAGKTTPLTILLVPGTSPTSTTGTGSISVTSSPSGASVNLDGWDKGTTPVTIPQVKAGSHTLTLTKTGYKGSITTVIVIGGQTATVTATLGPESQPTPGSGILTVRSTPSF